VELFDLEIRLGDILLAVLVLITWLSFRREGRLMASQQKLLSLQRELNARTLEKAQTADLGARFVREGEKKLKLRIFNRGGAAAHDVWIEFPEGSEAVNEQDVRDKFPHPKLEPHGSVDLIAVRSYDTRGRHTVQLTWRNEDGTEGREVAYPSF